MHVCFCRITSFELIPYPDFTQAGETNEWFCNVCTPANSDQIKLMSARAAQHHERNSSDHALNITESEKWWNPPPLDAAAWDAPIEEDLPLTVEEMKMRESQLRVDHLHEMVPFWKRSMEAAERGEILRLEEFLETMQEKSHPWLNAENPWQYAHSGGGWDNWGPQGKDTGWSVSVDANGWGAGDYAEGWGKSTASSNGSRIRTESSTKKRKSTKPSLKTATSPKESRNNVRLNPNMADSYTFVEKIAAQVAADAERKKRMHAFYQVSSIFSVWRKYLCEEDTHPREAQKDRRDDSPFAYHTWLSHWDTTRLTTTTLLCYR